MKSINERLFLLEKRVGIKEESDLEKAIVGSYEIGNHGKVNVRGTVFVPKDMTAEELAIKLGGRTFGFVSDNFWYKHGGSRKPTLKGGPTVVGGDCNIPQNMENLKYSPLRVNGTFNCGRCGLKSLLYSPSYIGGNFQVFGNKIQSLQGCPKEVKGVFWISENPGNFTDEEVRAVCKVGGKTDLKRIPSISSPNHEKLIKNGKIKVFEPETGEYYFDEELEEYMISLGRELRIIPKDASEENITEWVMSTGEQLDGLNHDSEGRIPLRIFKNAIKSTEWGW